LYILVFCASAALASQSDADALYRERATPGKAEAAAELWQHQLETNPANVDAAWKLARAMYWIGTHGPAAGQRPALERGVSAGRRAATLAPARPEGYFWMAANMGALAESFGMRQGLKYRGAIKDALETVLRIDPAFQQGSADRALGRWYHKVPGLFGGSEQKAEQHLRKSLTYDPNSTASHFFLAETLFELGRDREARAELQKVIDAPVDPDWEPEDRDFKEQALRRLR
jgi:tetratricopeptide (TPR) repeat protein